MPQIAYFLYATGAINPIYGTLAIGMLILFAWQLLARGRVCLNGIAAPSLLALALFGLLYMLFGDDSLHNFFYFMLCPMLAYLSGWITVEGSGIEPARQIKSIVYAFVLGNMLHAVLNYVTNIGVDRWKLKDVFLGELRAATGSGCINTVILSLAVYFVVLEKNALLKIAGIAAMLASLLYGLQLGTRTQFFVLAIISVVAAGLLLGERRGRSAGLKWCAALAILAGVAVFLYERNAFHLKEVVDTSNLMLRFLSPDLSDADSYRFESIGTGFLQLLDHPFGGLEDTKYYHNMWLDIGRVAGILPFALMVCYTVLINMHVIRIFRNKEHVLWLRYMLLCIYMGVQINFFVEPILEGMLNFFLLFTFLNGAVEYYYYRVERPMRKMRLGSVNRNGAKGTP